MRTIRTAGLALALAGIGAAGASQANAATFATWSCRGSATEVQVAQNSRVAPIVSEKSPCSDGSTGVPNVGEAVGIATAVTAKTAFGITSAAPPTVFPKDQTVGASAGVEGLVLAAIPGLTIGADAVRSTASASCKDGNPVFTGSSNAVNLTINGQVISADALLDSVVNPISNSPLGALVKIKFNEQIKTPTGIIQRGAHIIVGENLGGNGTPLLDVVIAESKLGSSSACDPNATNNGGGEGTTGAGGDALPQVCPTGSELDLKRGLCVIRAAASGGQGLIVVGVPYSGPSGGSVISLLKARKLYKSACLSGTGPAYVTIGTNKADRITGTNRMDRILAFGGNDAVDAGRNDDCIDGGKGNDNLAGGIGNDRVYGLSGKDALNGGPGKDRLSGGSGNDTINAAFGTDNIFGGTGVDFINVATAGKPARVDCGAGKDKVRFNTNESRRLRSCEVKYRLRD